MFTTRRFSKIAGAVVAAVTLGAGIIMPTAASAATITTQPIIHYSFTTAANNAANNTVFTNEGSATNSDATLSGSTAVTNGQIALTGSQTISVPTTALADKQDITVSVWMKNNFGKGNTAAVYIGNANTSKGYYLLNPANPAGYAKSVMTGATAGQPKSSPWNTEIGPGSTASANSGATATQDMALYTTVIHGSAQTMSFYRNGSLVGNSAYSIPQGGVTQYGDLVAYIGKSAYADPNSKLDVDDFAIYDTALSSQDVNTLYSDQALEKAEASVTVPSTATQDFPVASSVGAVTVAWQSNNAAISVHNGTASVTQPNAESGDADVTLTATFTLADQERSRTYHVNVPRTLSNQEKAQADLDGISIENANDMRTNFSLPTQGKAGSTIEWTVRDAGKTQAAITDGLQSSSKRVTVTRPSSGQPNATAVLTATVRNGETTLTQDFTVTVVAMPKSETQDEAYVWAYFTGEGVGGEKVSLAASKGNNALDWNTLNGGVPLFTSTIGEQGLRDPFIFKSKDGDKFYMIATDLKIAGRPNSAGGLSGFNGAQADGSLYIEIWESDDLVHWSSQRHAKVSSEYAGNTWAPEAYWDNEIGQYVVYWASNLYPTANPADRKALTYNRMMYVTTDDFVSFSEPHVWVDVDRRGQAGSGSIDATVQKEGDIYYRVYKDENSMTLRQEQSTDLLATVSGSYPSAQSSSKNATNQWTLMGEKIGIGQPNGYNGTFSAGEGPSLFKANPGDVNGYQYYLFADQPNYHGGPNHYVPLATTDISDASQWKVVGDKMPEAQFPTATDGGKPRHGTVLPVTRAQYEKVLEAYAPNIAVKSVEAVTLQTATGIDPTSQLPQQVKLTKVDGSSASTAVSWETINPASYAQAGKFTVRGVADDESKMPVEATVQVLSSDATLSSLKVLGKPVSLEQSASGKAVVVLDKPESVTTEDIVAVASNSEATVNTSVAHNEVTITVLAQDKITQRSYTVSLQKSKDNNGGNNGNNGDNNGGNGSQNENTDSKNTSGRADTDSTVNTKSAGQQLSLTGSSVALVLCAAVLTTVGAVALTLLRRRFANER